MLKTKSGKTFNVSGILVDEYLEALHIRVLGSSVEELKGVFSNADETDVLTYNDSREDIVYVGYTNLLLVTDESWCVEVMLSK